MKSILTTRNLSSKLSKVCSVMPWTQFLQKLCYLCQKFKNDYKLNNRHVMNPHQVIQLCFNDLNKSKIWIHPYFFGLCQRIIKSLRKHRLLIVELRSRVHTFIDSGKSKIDKLIKILTKSKHFFIIERQRLKRYKTMKINYLTP